MLMKGAATGLAEVAAIAASFLAVASMVTSEATYYRFLTLLGLVPLTIGVAAVCFPLHPLIPIAGCVVSMVAAGIALWGASVYSCAQVDYDCHEYGQCFRCDDEDDRALGVVNGILLSLCALFLSHVPFHKNNHLHEPSPMDKPVESVEVGTVVGSVVGDGDAEK